MRFLFFYSFIFLFSIIGFSQQQFNVTNDISDNPIGRNVFSTDSCYYLVGARRINNLAFVTAYKYDTLGNLLWNKTYGDTVFSWVDGYENNCVKTNEGYTLAASCTRFDIEPMNSYIRLYNFNLDFDTIWTQTYLLDTTYNEPTATAYCSDGGFAIAGWSKRDAETGEVLNYPKGFLLRTDSDGNYLWHKTYGTNDYKDTFYKVVQTPDGGFLCGGASQSYGSHTWDWYLVKTDANGIEEWHRTYGSMSYNDSRIMGITMTTDTNYIITGGIGLNGSDYGYYMKVLDNDFNLTKTVSAPTESIEAFYGQIKEIDEGFICIGGDRINTNQIAQTTLTKFDINLNEIWQRRYTVGDTTNTDNYISSVDTCSDGGFVMGGWAVHNGQKLALIKTDSLGCDGTDWWECSTGVMVNAFVSNIGFDIYPNPVAKDNNVQCVISNEQLSSFREGTTKPSIEIYNLTGKLVKTKPAHISTSSMSASFTIDISNLESGIYLVKVGQKIQKLIIDN